MVEPGIEPGTSWLVVRSSDHQTTRLVKKAVLTSSLEVTGLCHWWSDGIQTLPQGPLGILPLLHHCLTNSNLQRHGLFSLM
jgi:hypothetical protein